MVSWSRTYGGPYGEEQAHAIASTFDGGYIVAGVTWSFGAEVPNVWVLKLDGQGDVRWQRVYGGPAWDEVRAIAPTGDGGYVVAGWTGSFGGGWSRSDFWVLKLDGQGNIQWQKTYGGAEDDEAYAIAPTGDGSYVVAGWTESFGAGEKDIWVLKLDGQGNVQWQKTYGGSGRDWAFDIAPTGDGGYVVAGGTCSFGFGNCDFWVLKLDGQGNVQWQKTYGGPEHDGATAIAPTSDGGYVVTGGTESFGAGDWDIWVLKLDEQGNVKWQKTYGGTDKDVATSIIPTSDGGYVAAGGTQSFRVGDRNIWVLKLDGRGDVQWEKTYGGPESDEATAIVLTSDGDYVMAGTTDSFGAREKDFWVLKLGADGSIRGCPSGLVRDSKASVASTAVRPRNSSAVVRTTSASVRTSSATVGTTSISPTLVCSNE
jgi:uncharacterized delta-60 repeat protein